MQKQCSCNELVTNARCRWMKNERSLTHRLWDMFFPALSLPGSLQGPPDTIVKRALAMGIRFFELNIQRGHRESRKALSCRLYVDSGDENRELHVAAVFCDIRSFLMSHPSEIVVINIRKAAGCTSYPSYADVEETDALVRMSFCDLLGGAAFVPTNTFAKFVNSNQRVLYLYESHMRQLVLPRTTRFQPAPVTVAYNETSLEALDQWVDYLYFCLDANLRGNYKGSSWLTQQISDLIQPPITGLEVGRIPKIALDGGNVVTPESAARAFARCSAPSFSPISSRDLYLMYLSDVVHRLLRIEEARHLKRVSSLGNTYRMEQCDPSDDGCEGEASQRSISFYLPPVPRSKSDSSTTRTQSVYFSEALGKDADAVHICCEELRKLFFGRLASPQNIYLVLSCCLPPVPVWLFIIHIPGQLVPLENQAGYYIPSRFSASKRVFHSGRNVLPQHSSSSRLEQPTDGGNGQNKDKDKKKKAVVDASNAEGPWWNRRIAYLSLPPTKTTLLSRSQLQQLCVAHTSITSTDNDSLLMPKHRILEEHGRCTRWLVPKKELTYNSLFQWTKTTTSVLPDRVPMTRDEFYSLVLTNARTGSFRRMRQLNMLKLPELKGITKEGNSAQTGVRRAYSKIKTLGRRDDVKRIPENAEFQMELDADIDTPLTDEELVVAFITDIMNGAKQGKTHIGNFKSNQGGRGTSGANRVKVPCLSMIKGFNGVMCNSLEQNHIRGLIDATIELNFLANFHDGGSSTRGVNVMKEFSEAWR